MDTAVASRERSDGCHEHPTASSVPYDQRVVRGNDALQRSDENLYDSIPFSVCTDLPLALAQWIDGLGWAAVFAFIQVFTLWSLQRIALEIENPFGTDANDLDAPAMQEEFNEFLVQLVSGSQKRTPTLSTELTAALQGTITIPGDRDRDANLKRCSLLDAWTSAGQRKGKLRRGGPGSANTHSFGSQARLSDIGSGVTNFGGSQTRLSDIGSPNLGGSQARLSDIGSGVTEVFSAAGSAPTPVSVPGNAGGSAIGFGGSSVFGLGGEEQADVLVYGSEGSRGSQASMTKSVRKKRDPTSRRSVAMRWLQRRQSASASTTSLSPTASETFQIDTDANMCEVSPQLTRITEGPDSPPGDAKAPPFGKNGTSRSSVEKKSTKGNGSFDELKPPNGSRGSLGSVGEMTGINPEPPLNSEPVPRTPYWLASRSSGLSVV